MVASLYEPTPIGVLVQYKGGGRRVYTNKPRNKQDVPHLLGTRDQEGNISGNLICSIHHYDLLLWFINVIQSGWANLGVGGGGSYNYIIIIKVYQPQRQPTASAVLNCIQILWKFWWHSGTVCYCTSYLSTLVGKELLTGNHGKHRESNKYWT